MEDITNDPIIAFYMKMSNSTDTETEVPLFSETMLRLSFKQVFGSMRPLNSKELLLYRKLLLFNFSENYTSITDLVAIMTCFDELQIRECFDEHESIIAQWHNFLKEVLLSVLFKEALNEILCEYVRRYLVLFTEIGEDVLKRKANEVLKFLRFENRLPKQWYRAFNSVLQNRVEKEAQSENYNHITMEDLEISNIYMDIQHRLNILVVEAVAKYDNEFFKEPAAKHAKTEELKIIKVEVIPTANDDFVKVETKDKSYSDAKKYGIDTEIQITNESDLNDEEYEYSSTSNIEQVQIKTEQRAPQEILQRVDLVNDDDSEEYDEMTEITLNTCEDNDDNDANKDCIEIYDLSQAEDDESNDDDDDDDSTQTQGGIVNKDTALSYLAALQAYVVVNGHFQAIELLDKVDSLLREKN